ncbi:hypothetical protein [Lichenicoccus sp.]|uniref:hypothetical protein n=1 Tax=Lichenicoccus sp. TaxID=2781899 RepID=UPI003D106011
MDVQIRRADLPAETSQAIYDRMMSERLREAKELRAGGFEWGQTIRAKADRDRTVLLSDALRQRRATSHDARLQADLRFRRRIAHGADAVPADGDPCDRRRRFRAERLRE